MPQLLLNSPRLAVTVFIYSGVTCSMPRFKELQIRSSLNWSSGISSTQEIVSFLGIWQGTGSDAWAIGLDWFLFNREKRMEQERFCGKGGWKPINVLASFGLYHRSPEACYSVLVSCVEWPRYSATSHRQSIQTALTSIYATIHFAEIHDGCACGARLALFICFVTTSRRSFPGTYFRGTELGFWHRLQWQTVWKLQNKTTSSLFSSLELLFQRRPAVSGGIFPRKLARPRHQVNEGYLQFVCGRSLIRIWKRLTAVWPVGTAQHKFRLKVAAVYKTRFNPSETGRVGHGDKVGDKSKKTHTNGNFGLLTSRWHALRKLRSCHTLWMSWIYPVLENARKDLLKDLIICHVASKVGDPELAEAMEQPSGTFRVAWTKG